VEDNDEEMEDEDNETEGELLNQSDSEESDAISDDDDDREEDDDVELRNKIVEALHANGIDAASNDSEDEEELMDDEQMMAIDEQLVQVFRSRANEKKSGKSKFYSNSYGMGHSSILKMSIFNEKQHISRTVCWI